MKMNQAGKQEIQGMHSKAQIEKVKQQIADGNKEYLAAYEQFLMRANDALNREPSAPEEYYVPWYYVQSKEHIESSKLLTGDAYAAYTCALSYQLSDNIKYAEKAREIINYWASNNKVLKPIEDTPLVAANGGIGLVIAAQLLKDYTGWQESEQAQFHVWLKANYQPLVDMIKAHKNNWACWGTMAAMQTYCYLNDMEGVKGEIERLKTIINDQISSQGDMPEESKRGNNSMWYYYFALAPITAAAQIAFHATGENIYEYVSEKGTSIKQALDYLKIYVKDPSLWPHHPPAELNKPRLSNGQDKGNYSNWPTSLYEAMKYVYTDSDPITDEYSPVLGGWFNDRGAHHIAWCFPSLMRP